MRPATTAGIRRCFPQLSVAALALVLTLVLALAAGCGGFKRAPSGLAEGQAKFAATSYINEGRRVHLIVDVRSSRLRGPDRWLAMQVAMLNVSDDEQAVTPESFVFETADRRSLPLASFEEFRDDYTRQRVDARVGNDFRESLLGRYPTPPYQWRALNFFPDRETGTPPRDRMVLRPGQMAVGWLYFSLPSEDMLGEDGRGKLLVRPSSGEETFVVDVQAYRESRRRSG